MTEIENVPYKLPEGWTWIKLEGVAKEIQDGDWITKEYQSDSGIRLIQTGNIGVGRFIEKKNKKYITEGTFKQLNCNEVFEGDILISRLPKPVGRGCVIPYLKTRMVTAVDCTICRVNKRINKMFLLYFLNSRINFIQIRKYLTGSSRKRISRRNLEKVLIPIPFKNGKPDLEKQNC